MYVGVILPCILGFVFLVLWTLIREVFNILRKEAVERWDHLTCTLYVLISAELGTRFFLRFTLALSRSWAELFALALSRSFLGLKFRAFAFEISRSRAPRFFALFFRAPKFFALFSRSSIFRARTLAILDLRACFFALVLLRS
jgi:hypothetical protein